MSTLPEVRALWAQVALRRRARFSSEERETAGFVEPTYLDQTHTALAFEWLPAEMVLAVTDANARMGLRSAAVDFLRDELLRPPLGAMVRGLRRAAGGDPLGAAQTILRYGMHSLIRQCGEIRIDVDDGRLVVQHIDPPSIFVDSLSYREVTWVSAILGIVGLESQVSRFEEDGGDLLCIAEVTPESGALRPATGASRDWPARGGH